MEKLIIEGGYPLEGNLAVSGAKNAALPILFACLLAKGEVVVSNVPNLQDIRTTLKLLKFLGCSARLENGIVTAYVNTLCPEAPYELVRTMRASVLCLGPLLALLGEAIVPLPGGCAIGARPIDQHQKALEKMGAQFEMRKGNVYGKCTGLHGAHITHGSIPSPRDYYFPRTRSRRPALGAKITGLEKFKKFECGAYILQIRNIRNNNFPFGQKAGKEDRECCVFSTGHGKIAF